MNTYICLSNIESIHPKDKITVRTHWGINGYTVSVGCDYNHNGTRAYLLYRQDGFSNRYLARKSGENWLKDNLK